MKNMQFEKVILEGEHVRLEALGKEHKEGLAAAILDGELWKLFVTLVPPVEELDTFLENAQQDFLGGDGLAFAVIDKNRACLHIVLAGMEIPFPEYHILL